MNTRQKLLNKILDEGIIKEPPLESMRFDFTINMFGTDYYFMKLSKDVEIKIPAPIKTSENVKNGTCTPEEREEYEDEIRQYVLDNFNSVFSKFI